MDTQEKLSVKAYETMDGSEYPPCIPAEASIPEFTLKSVVLGAIIGALFGAANAYLGLKVGLTVSASIPAAVMAVAVFRLLRTGTLLETNMVQTIGSAGESLAAGVIFTVPAFFLWGLEPAQMEIVLISILGGMLGVLFMIPLRRFLIVKEHGKLPYPEGTACAEVQVAGRGDLSRAKALFAGMGIGGLYQFLMGHETLALWSKEPYYQFQRFKGALLAGEVTPELLGVGYIIGPRIAAIMLGGGLLGWFVLIPLITLFGAHITAVVPPETSAPLNSMGPWAVWSKYVRYIGAGGVAFAGIFSLLKTLPVIVTSFREGVRGLGSRGETAVLRTEQDLPMSVILLGSLTLAILIALYLVFTVFQAHIFAAIVAAILIVVFAFFFVTVSSRIVGLLGSSSNPVSGMTIATLIITCLIFFLFGLDKLPNAGVCALTVGAFVCIAAAIAGDTSQDLKTGFLLGATPRLQQLGEFIGVLSAGLTMGAVMYLLKDDIVSGVLPAPQANLMKLVIDGVIGQSLPWGLVISGMFIAAVVEMLGINSLAFAVGLYLPMSLSTPIMMGGLIRWWVDRSPVGNELDSRREAGILYASGLIAGAALIGLLITLMVPLRDKTALVSTVAQVLKKPGIHLSLPRDAKARIDGKEVGQYLSAKLGDYAPREVRSFEVEVSQGSSSTSKKLSLGKWDRKFLSLKNGEIHVESERENAIPKGLIAFLILTLSLVYVVRKKGG
jgi:putative OPT family oligopeptide transporter